MKKQIVTVVLLCLSFIQIQAQCIVEITSNRKTICANQSAILKANFNEIIDLKDTFARKRIANIAEIKEIQNVKPIINMGGVKGLTLPFPDNSGYLELDYSPVKLQKTMISSGTMYIYITTDLIQNNKIKIEFPHILKDNKHLIDSILIDSKDLKTGSNLITKRIDLAGYSIDFSTGDATKYNSLMYTAKTTSTITTNILVGNETVDMDIKLSHIKYSTNTNFVWFKDDVKLDNKNTSTIEVTSPGIYRVDASLLCGVASDTISITKNPTVVASISTNDKTVICAGDTSKLLGQTDSTYSLQWLYNEKNIPGATSMNVFALTTGIYQLKVSDGICEALSNSINISVNPLPTLEITNLEPFILKNQEYVYLSATPKGGTFKGEGIQGSVFYPTAVTLGKKSISYTYTSPQGCTNTVTKNTLIVDSTGKVYTKYDTITVTNTVTKYDTVKINKYDTITITNNVTKYDTVKVNTYDTITITNNVTKYDTITVTDTVNILKINFKLTTGIKANQMTSMSIYPNPTSDVLIIDASDLAAVTGYSYRILDALGKEVYNALVTTAKTEISLKTLGAKGMYVLHILDANKQSVQTKQIILE